MADAAMASVPASGGPSPFSAAPPPIGGLEALKYAAQADMFQDDPNFYAWLEDWIGRQDEETIMVDAVSTLNDYNLQFDEFQQQQQHPPRPSSQRQQQQQQHALQQDPVGAPGPQAPLQSTCVADTGHGSSGPPQCQYRPLLLQDLQRGVSSSCASMASHPSSRPSDDSNPIGSPSESADHIYPPQSSRLAGADTPALSPQSHCPSSAVPSDANPRKTDASGSSGVEPMCVGTSKPSEPAPAPGLLADLHHYLLGDAAVAGSSLDTLEARIHSHGTVSSFVGAPAAAVQGPSRTAAPAPAAADIGGPSTSTQATQGAAGLIGSGVPSMEVLIARALCGSNNIGRRLTGLSSIGLGGSGGSVTIATQLGRRRNAGGGDSSMDMGARSSGEMGSGGSRCEDALEPGRLAAVLGSHGGPKLSQQCRGNSSSLLAGAHGNGHHNTHHHHHHAHSYRNHNHNSHNHNHNSIPVSNAAVGKVVALNWGRGAGVSTTGRPTRSARAKALFAALEAEVAGKLDELEVLQREHVSLTQRVEILEVAIERQSIVLNMMSITASGGGSGGVSGEAHGEGGGAPWQQQSQGLPGLSRATALAAAASGSEKRLGEMFLTPALRTAACSSESGRPTAGPSLSPWALMDAMTSMPSGVDSAEMVEWARTCTIDMYKARYKEKLQNMSLTLLALENGAHSPAAEAKIVELVAEGQTRTILVSLFQPLTQLRLKGLNLETDTYLEPSDEHWLEVIKFMTVSPEQIAEMENLFHSYNLLHDSFRAELQDTQRDLAELVMRQDGAGKERHCSGEALTNALQQTALLKRVRRILQKIHLLYSCTIGVAAMRILKPKEFAKCCVQSYPYYPCGPSLMKACMQMRTMSAIYGTPCCGN